MGDIIKEDLWVNPLQYFNNVSCKFIFLNFSLYCSPFCCLAKHFGMQEGDDDDVDGDDEDDEDGEGNVSFS